MPSTTEIRFKKHGAADAGGRKKRNHNNRGPMEHFPGLMTKAEVDNWFEEAKKMPLVWFFFHQLYIFLTPFVDLNVPTL